jgi:hypothetical protein
MVVRMPIQITGRMKMYLYVPRTHGMKHKSFEKLAELEKN